jgi:hypothetical protein
MDGFLVEPQNQDRVGTTWELSHEWLLAEATLSSQGFQWFTRKPLDSVVDPQSQDSRLKTEVQQHRTGLIRRYWSDRGATTQSGESEAKDTCQDRKACVEAKQVCGR